MAGDAASPRSAALAARLDEVATELIAIIETIDLEHWMAVPRPGVWSIGKDAAHVADASLMHQWLVRRTIGQPVPALRPPIERSQMTTPVAPAQMAAIIRQRAGEGARLVRGLTEAELELRTRPPRARGERLAGTIERLLIGHVQTHRAEIERKLRRGGVGR